MVKIMHTGTILPVYAADPHIYIAGDRYVIASTNAGIYRSKEAFDAGDAGEEGHGFALWSSADLQEWRSEGPVLRFANIAWAEKLDRAWAPCTAQRNGRTYFYFCAADRIGVATSSSAIGPFREALGKPLVAYREDLSAIDPMVFVDVDGQAYLFWGAVPAAWLHNKVSPILSHLSVQRLSANMISLQGDEVATISTEPDPNGNNGFGPHIEASHVIRRDSPEGRPTYYLMYSQGSWSNNDDAYLYHVRYATADHPLGPWTKQPSVTLSTRRDLDRIGPGHHSTLHLPGVDEWFIVYHAHGGNCDRRLFINHMYFGEKGEIIPVDITTEVPPKRPLTLGLELAEMGPYSVAWPIRFRIITHQAFLSFQLMEGKHLIGEYHGEKTQLQWIGATVGFHRVFLRGITINGVKIQSAAVDFDCV